MRASKFFFLLLALVVSSAHAYELDESSLRSHEKTSVPSQSRYEFVQSPIVAKCTFKVEKYTGQVYQIVQKSDGELAWEEIFKLKHPLDKLRDKQVNYQLFMYGIVNKFIFLI